MTFDEKKVALNKYSKETIVNYLASGRFISFEELLKGLEHQNFADKIRKDQEEFERLSNADAEAIDNLINYKKELASKYGNSLKISDLTIDELNKLSELQKTHEKNNRAYMRYIKKDLKKR